MDKQKSLVVERMKLNSSDVYYSGQQVEGQVVIACKRKIKLESLILKIIGVARHKWTMNEVDSRDDLRVVKSKSSLRNSYDGETPLWAYQTHLLIHSEVDAGDVRCFDFATTIPANCPTSFEGEHGFIRYEVSLIADEAIEENNIQELYRERLRVVKPLNLLKFPFLLLPLTIEKTTNFSKSLPLAATQTPLHLSVTLPRNAFVPGEVLPIRIEIEKADTLQILPVEVTLNRFTSYTSYVFRAKPYTVTMAQRTALVYRLIETTEKSPWSRRSFEEHLRIPLSEGTTTHITDCSVLQVHYELNVRVVGVSKGRSLILRLPFVLGSHADSTQSSVFHFTVGGSYQSHDCCAIYNRDL